MEFPILIGSYNIAGFNDELFVEENGRKFSKGSRHCDDCIEHNINNSLYLNRVSKLSSSEEDLYLHSLFVVEQRYLFGDDGSYDNKIIVESANDVYKELLSVGLPYKINLGEHTVDCILFGSRIYFVGATGSIESIHYSTYLTELEYSEEDILDFCDSLVCTDLYPVHNSMTTVGF